MICEKDGVCTRPCGEDDILCVICRAEFKASRVYVHFGDSTHLPMYTLPFKSSAAALTEVKRTLAEGWPARIQK